MARRSSGQYQLEEVAEHIGSATNRELTEELVRKQAEREPLREAACPDCGGATRFKGRYEQELVTTQGRVRVARAYYYCAACGKGSCPLDRSWGLGPANATPAVQARTAVLAVWVPYTRLPEVTGQLRLAWPLDVKSSEAITQRVGEAVRQSPPVGCGAAERPVVVAVDGVFLLTRDEGWKEARCAVVYEPDFEVGRRADECAALRKEYVGGLADRETVLTRACARALVRQLPGVPIAALGDGAHSGALWALGRLCSGASGAGGDLGFLPRVPAPRAGGPSQTSWRPGDVRPVVNGTTPRTPPSRPVAALTRTGRLGTPRKGQCRGPESTRCGVRLLHSQPRADAVSPLRAEGLPTGSGAVGCPSGGACKHLVAARFKQAGMRWGRDTAEPLIHLRAALLSQPGIDLRGYAGTTRVN